jgi:branched-chain amino acid transport system ATP-binding protein
VDKGIIMLLEINNIEVIYKDTILVLKGISLGVEEGKIFCLLGSNGAGKSTTLKAISGLLKLEDGAVTDGNIKFHRERIDQKDADEIVRMGILHVMEGRKIFATLNIVENLVVGAHTRKRGQNLGEGFEVAFNYFPVLRNRMKVKAGYLSGGEQQMLVIGRALMSEPLLLLLDEPSLGLAPLLAKHLFEIIKKINEERKTTILLVEQNAHMAFSISSYGYIMENGMIVLDDPVTKLIENENVKEFYLGLAKGGKRKSFTEVKHYKRKKRWFST